MDIELTRGERFKDARLVHNKHGKQGMGEVEAATGVASSMISNLENDEIKRGVSCDKIATLANHYGVSVDYLLGLDDYPRTEATLRAAREYTGLSSEAVEAIHSLQVDHEHSLEKQMINALITSEPFMKRYIKTLIDVFVYRNTLSKTINEARDAYYHPRVGSAKKRDELQSIFKDTRYSILDYNEASQEMLYSLFPDLKQIIAEAEQLINGTQYDGTGPHFNDTWGYGKKEEE